MRPLSNILCTMPVFNSYLAFAFMDQRGDFRLRSRVLNNYAMPVDVVVDL